MKPNLDASKHRHETSSENGKKGGAPRGNQNARKNHSENNQKTTEKQPDNQPQNKPNSTQNKQDKEKDKDMDLEKEERKINKAVKPPQDAFDIFAGEDKKLLEALREFEQMRKRIKKPLSDGAKERLVRKLKKEIPPGEMIEAIYQSCDHCWQDVFPLKGGNNDGARNFDKWDKPTIPGITVI